MGPFDIENLKLKQIDKNKKIIQFHPPQKKFVRTSRDERFLKGPIPLNWLTHASKLPGKTLQVAIALWYLKGLKKKNVVKLTNVTLSEFGVNVCLQKVLDKSGIEIREGFRFQIPFFGRLSNL